MQRRNTDLTMARVELQPAPLICLECESVSGADAQGWKAYLGGTVDGEDLEVGIFCPDCAEREFGD